MKKTLKIAMLAPLEERVPPIKYGGTELVVANLCTGLARAGHDVTLMAAGTSKTSARLIPIVPQPIRTAPEGKDPKTREAAKLAGLASVVQVLQKNKFDIVHNHLGWRLLPFSKLIAQPLVTTLHGPLDSKYQQYILKQYKHLDYVNISNNQKQPLPGLRYHTVYNGIAVEKFSLNLKPKSYLAWLGRFSPEKGPLQAIQTAKKAKLPLIMAGKVDQVDKEYFTKKVKPLIDGKQIKFIGEVDHPGKVKLLSNAQALLALIQWREPFGLFVVEAMACGTPVIATRRGALPELISQNITGFFVSTPAQAAAAIKKIPSLSRQRCRDHVAANFSLQKMSQGYLDVYHQAIKNQSKARP